jgi:predicted alpha/beta superfamily hydrolase
MDENQQHTATSQVKVIDGQFEIPQLGVSRRIWIYLPKEYELTDRSYPVIYMQDGQNLFDAATASYAEWGVDEFMEQVPADKQSIIVGIDHGDADRMFEYNPFDTEDGPGKGNSYADFLAETLKPFIDQQYRTLSDAEHTTVAGSSLGGLISMFTALKYPGAFGRAGIFSPAFWIAKDIYAYALSREGIERSRFYFVCGDSESESMVGDMQGMADIINGKTLSEESCKMVVISGAEHNEQQWQGDFPAFYNWLFA